MPTHRLLIALSCVAALCGAARADTLASPAGEVVLAVTGAIGEANGAVDGAPAGLFDEAMLRALPQHEVTRASPFLEGVNTWSGPLAWDVLEAVGASGETAVARALDDYVAEIPIDLLRRGGAILALDLNGAPLPPEFGPVWIAWPQSSEMLVPAENQEHYWVWSLVRITVE